MKDQNDKNTKDLELGIETSHGYFDKRWCSQCKEYRHFYDIEIIDGKHLMKCSHCPNALFVDG